jgi:thymidylate synthase (FAD)
MKVKLIDCTTDAAFNIAHAARTCYNSHDKDTLANRAGFIKGLIKSGHETPLEFAHTMWEIEGISRVCQNQIVRHRIASYCVLSERYVDVSQLDCILPYNLLKEYDGAVDYVNQAKKVYKFLINSGVPKEDARMLLPQGMETTMCMDMNFRSLRHFLKLRLDKHAQWEIRQVAEEILNICKEKWPWLVEDLKSN